VPPPPLPLAVNVGDPVDVPAPPTPLDPSLDNAFASYGFGGRGREDMNQYDDAMESISLAPPLIDSTSVPTIL
jgi:hypothetical protein